MIKLLNIELKKVLSYAGFWVFISLYAAFLVLLFMLAQGFNMKGGPGIPGLSAYYVFPDMWHTLTYLAGWFNLLPGVLVAVLMTNEFTYRTLRQNLIDGWSVNEFVLAKVILLVFLALCAALFVFLFGMVYGLIASPVVNVSTIFSQISFVLAYFVQAIAYFSFALLMGTLFKKAGLAIMFFLLYIILAERIIAWILPNYISEYLPFQTISNLIENPWFKILGVNVRSSPLGIHFAFALFYSTLFIAAAWLLLKKRDN